VWDERDLPPQRPTRATGHNLPQQGREGATGDHLRVTGTAPVVRADGTLFLPPGTLFHDKYAVIEVLGEGAISVVHKARHSVMKNIVVIKLLKGTYASNSKTVLRFQRDGQAMSRLNHQNIVRTFDFGISREGQPFLAIEYLDGKSLAALLKEHGAPPLPMALAIFSQVADALTSAHAAGFVHRGMKPSNIFILGLATGQRVVKLVDFGVADVFDEDEEGQKKVPQGGKFFGDPRYMSPEQCLGKTLDDRTDIYSLGCVMYEGLTGAPPFAGANTNAILQKQSQENPRPFREVAPDRTDLALIEPVVFKCLAKDPGSRYQTMAQLSRALKEVDQAGMVGTAGSAPADNSEALAAEEQERRREVLLRRVLIAAAVVVVLLPVIPIVLFKTSEVDVALSGPGEHAGFAIDRGQYQEAKKQIESMLAEARKANLKADVVRLLTDQAALEHILADKTAEAKDDKEIADINEAGGAQIYVNAGAIEAIDALLASDKSTADLEQALKDPVQKMVTITQSLAWSQQYGPAQEAMALLIDKVSRKLGADSPLVVDLKLQYASRLLQKIINPATPLTLHEQQDLVGEPKASLETPLTLGSGSDLLLARSNFALAQAISGNEAEAIKLRDDVMATYKNQTTGPDNASLIEARLGDTDMALNDPESALPMFKSAYQKFLADKKYPQAAFCVAAHSRACWLSDQLKQSYEFLTGELAKPEVAAPEGEPLKAALQGWLSQLDFWMATADEGILKQFFPDRKAIKKSSGELRRDAERLAMESLLSLQSLRPSELWLSNPALDTLTKVYFDGNTVGRSIPILRLKLAIAQRTNTARANDEARNGLGAALLGYSKSSLASAYASYDHSQILLDQSDPVQEAKALYSEGYKDVTTGGDKDIFWLDQWFADLAAKFIESDADKVLLTGACSKSCYNVGELYGKNSLEYLGQLRWYGRLCLVLGRVDEAKKSLISARDVAAANAQLPLLDRLYIYNDLISVCSRANDTAGVKKYTAEMNALPKP
jgi:hypothetical protein